jgi:hypothetical protein
MEEGMISITSTIIKGITMIPLPTPTALQMNIIRMGQYIETHTISHLATSAKAKVEGAEMED